ncbi:SDR family oxidoreductase [Steroidobacter sp.]|uniref:SDR family oxidoreductase n=1 Tax=Steroidobacter sp. TaxID=1978227 RepID=UPI001A375F64|nr:NAD(P)-dependent oxidoreductase [Steroidobacter sp.]MBL8265343.1 NAD(P)-dependent oxidoreductase [Steroidobacter sp.]
MVLQSGSLAGKTLFITGASRGIGRAIALRAARDGANVVIAAKTVDPHQTLEGTILTAARSVEAAGGRALPLQLDIRDEQAVAVAMHDAAEHFGGIDILINNASAVALADTASVSMRRFDLMHAVNARGTFLCTKLALPYLRMASNAHVLNLAPPLELDARWFAPHAAYTLAKIGMSLCTLAHAEEFRPWGIAVNALWPLTTVATAAVSNVFDPDGQMRSRSPEIVADAAHYILTRPAREVSGNFFIDEEVLRAGGITDFARYDLDPPGPRTADLFLPEAVLQRAANTISSSSSA